MLSTLSLTKLPCYQGTPQRVLGGLGLERSPSPPSVSKRSVVDIILVALEPTHARGQLNARIFVAEVSYSFAPRSAWHVNGLLTFSESPLKQLV